MAWTAFDLTFREKVLEMERAHSRGNFHSGFDASLLLQLLANRCFRVTGKQPLCPVVGVRGEETGRGVGTAVPRYGNNVTFLGKMLIMIWATTEKTLQNLVSGASF